MEISVTVRFSFRGEIGLPRFFTETIFEALNLIRKYRDLRWTTIVHEYLDVRDSFEIFIDLDRMILEHVPGIWESKTSLAPDVLINESGKWEGLRVSNPRIACIVSPEGKREVEVEPECTDRLKIWAKRLSAINAEIHARFRDSLPLICHCVAEEKDEWQFLNIRKSGHLRRRASISRGFHIVTNLDDLRAWDGQTPILLRILVDRGSEESLADLVPELPERDELIFIDFGALSHPAIMLRELGINPTPVYLTHETVDLTKDLEDIA